MWGITPVWITCLFKDPINEALTLSVVMLKSEASRYSWISISYNPQEIWRIKICTTWSGIQKPHPFLKTRNTPRRLRITLKDRFFYLYDFSLRYSKQNKTKQNMVSKPNGWPFLSSQMYVMNGSDSPNFQHSTDQNWTEEAFHLLRIQSLSLKYFSS